MASVDVPVAAPAGGVSRGVHVLVVDDSTDHRTLMQRTLQKAGFDVDVAATAEEASERLQDAPTDLVIVDYRMPGTTGIELLEEIAQLASPPSVVMVTGAGNTDVAVEAMRLGAIDYVSKDRGYLDTLPDVVLRAWRHHDLASRARDLHRLSLLVASAQDRDGLRDEVLAGAASLLRTTACVLLLEDDGRLHRVAAWGDPPDLLTDLAGASVADVCGDGTPRYDDARLLVPLPRGDGTCIGLLVAWTDAIRQRDEELELAAAFAAFAGIALRNLQQRELEQRLVAELQQTVDARRDFITSVSHELRTPMTSIAGFASTLVDHWDQLDVAQRLDMLQRVKRNSDDLRTLVEEMVDLAALDRGQSVAVNPLVLDVAEQVGDVVVDSAEILGDRQVTVDVPEVAVRADTALLRRTMHNLLTNAVKYSADGTAIEIRAHVAERHVRVEVEDHGIGLEPRVAARVFDPFFRATPSVENAVRGAGIGLALVKEYVRLMRGEIGVRSTPGHGSTFWFTLPRAAVEPAGLGSADEVVTLDDPDAGWSSSVSSPGS